MMMLYAQSFAYAMNRTSLPPPISAHPQNLLWSILQPSAEDFEDVWAAAGERRGRFHCASESLLLKHNSSTGYCSNSLGHNASFVVSLFRHVGCKFK